MLQIISAIVFLVFAYLCLKAFKDPGIALGLVWSLYAMEQLLQQGNSLLLSNSSLLNFIVAGVAAAVAARNIALGKIDLRRLPTIVTLTFLLFVYAGLSLLWSPDFSRCASKFQVQLPYLIIYILIAPLCVSDTRQIEKAVQVSLYFGGLILLGLLFSTVSNRAIVLTEVGGEVVKGNPLAVASYAGSVLLTAMFFLYSKKSAKARMAIYLVIAAIAMLTLSRSGSRGQMVAVVIAAFSWLPITAKVAAKRSTVIAIIAAAVATIALIYVVANSDYASRWNSETVEVATFGRLQMVEDLLYAWGRGGPGTWIFGLGNSASYPVIGFYPHVVLPEVLGEEGLIGLTLFLAVIFNVFYQGIRWMRSTEIETTSRVYLGLMLAYFTFELALTFKQSSLVGASPAFCYCASVGWYFASLKKKRRRHIALKQRHIYAPNPARI